MVRLEKGRRVVGYVSYLLGPGGEGADGDRGRREEANLI
jgi:hypothetical protein